LARGTQVSPGAVADRLGRYAGQFGEPGKTGGSFDEAEYHPSTMPTVDSVGLPVTDVLALRHLGRAMLDTDAAWDLATALAP
jgi:hypothetical protein